MAERGVEELKKLMLYFGLITVPPLLIIKTFEQLRGYGGVSVSSYPDWTVERAWVEVDGGRMDAGGVYILRAGTHRVTGARMSLFAEETGLTYSLDSLKVGEKFYPPRFPVEFYVKPKEVVEIVLYYRPWYVGVK